MDLARRSDQAEHMDDPALPRADYERCLRDLAAVNRITFTHRPTLRWLGRAIGVFPKERAVSILDVACGGGDLLRSIHGWAERQGIAVQLEGLDLNPRSALAAAVQTPPEWDISWRTGSVFDYAPDPAPDFIVTSQFTHHLSDPEIVRFLRWLEHQATRGWFIADLHRASFAYWGFGLLARVARWHPIVRSDGMISVARGFRRVDWQRLLAEAGVPGEIEWHLAFRWCVGRLK